MQYQATALPEPIAVWIKAVPGTSQAGREKVEVPGGLVDSSTGGVPSSSVPDTPKLPLCEGADLTLLGLDCWRPSPCLLLLRLRALLLLACIINNHIKSLYLSSIIMSYQPSLVTML